MDAQSRISLSMGREDFELCILVMVSVFLGVTSEGSSSIDGVDLFEELPELTYAQLETTRHFRILRLLPERSCSTIKCELIHTSVAEHSQYEAVSYTWDDPTKTDEIIVNGCRFRTSTKSYSLLLSQRHPWIAKYLWIDFICINQADDVEKGHQISLMRDIYQNALQVTIWLGNATNADVATALLCELATMIRHGQTLDAEFYKKAARETERPRWTALSKLVSNSWFRRIWIVQEVVVAPKLDVIYGGQHISWMDLFLVMHHCSASEMLELLQTTSNGGIIDCDQDGIGNMRILFALRILYEQNQNWTLGQLLEATRRFNATISKDKVFALLGIASDVSNPRLKLNYTDSDEQIFIQVSHYLFSPINSPEPLFTLPLAGIGLRRLHPKLPSWVVDWSGSENTQMMETFSGLGGDLRFRAAGDSQAFIDLDANKNKLQLRGFRVDEVLILAALYEIPFEAPPDTPFRGRIQASRASAVMATGRWYRELQALTESHAMDSYPTGQPLDEVMWRTLIADRTQSTMPIRPAPDEYGRGYGVWKKNLENQRIVLQGTSDAALSAAIPFLHAFNTRQMTGESLYGLAWVFRNEILDLPPETPPPPPFSTANPPSDDEWREIVIQSVDDINTPIEIKTDVLHLIGLIDQVHNRESSEAINTSTKISPERATFVDEAPLGNMYNAATRVSYGRRFCVTKNGYVGLVPPGSEIGDGVYILLGAGAPYLLREKGRCDREDEGETEMELVGECYFHGMMDGEMMGAGKVETLNIV